ncbi:hypothetical protein BSS2_II0273 [Brucella suis bv. 1 str. S2]|uniref:Uncharacterized protein n=1 Tax=Brucella suis biovar 1 (strain 1330) TaxID=204722 RepID=A0A0H3GAK5_BRUSU|nr:hypothetical protein BRA0288 [Brucella suis 1330]AEM19767.1 hypothetical protein BS1330_II0285 [Brucella suis 1330]AEU07437.1 hypothetical protein BSVBI22_B0284 [Brucella suis VBI22]AHN48037.1 hypothetical protein BSS2_II0273 [Brucella suis bv. 1 str. S2]
MTRIFSENRFTLFGMRSNLHNGLPLRNRGHIALQPEKAAGAADKALQ